MAKLERRWEFIMVDDGSTDGTRAAALAQTKTDPRIRVVGYDRNAGRGKALRTGIAAAKGDVVVTTDFDLSYDPSHITRIFRELEADPEIDVVIGSAYMEGGQAIGVPWFRLFVSKLGNRILSFAMGSRFKTITCVLRGYRRDVIQSLELESNGKEIHLEILSKLCALGYNIKEIPATLRARKRGRSKFRLRATAISHLLFSLYERPMMLFGLLGVVFLILGVLVGGYLFVQYWHGRLNPERPLMTVLVVLLLGGVQILAFGFLAIQLLGLRKEIYILQRENKEIQAKLDRKMSNG
jgi:glycosyltransferase involved in cell wall biosynthesis